MLVCIRKCNFKYIMNIHMKACYICTFMNTYKHKPAQHVYTYIYICVHVYIYIPQHVVKRAACCSVLLQCVGSAKRHTFQNLISILRFSNHGLIISPNACSSGICGQPQAAIMRPIFGRDSTSVEFSSFWVALWLLLRVVAPVQVCCVLIFCSFLFSCSHVEVRLLTTCYLLLFSKKKVDFLF